MFTFWKVVKWFISFPPHWFSTTLYQSNPALVDTCQVLGFIINVFKRSAKLWCLLWQQCSNCPGSYICVCIQIYEWYLCLYTHTHAHIHIYISFRLFYALNAQCAEFLYFLPVKQIKKLKVYSMKMKLFIIHRHCTHTSGKKVTYWDNFSHRNRAEWSNYLQHVIWYFMHFQASCNYWINSIYIFIFL